MTDKGAEPGRSRRHMTQISKLLTFPTTASAVPGQLVNPTLPESESAFLVEMGKPRFTPEIPINGPIRADEVTTAQPATHQTLSDFELSSGEPWRESILDEESTTDPVSKDPMPKLVEAGSAPLADLLLSLHHQPNILPSIASAFHHGEMQPAFATDHEIPINDAVHDESGKKFATDLSTIASSGLKLVTAGLASFIASPSRQSSDDGGNQSGNDVQFSADSLPPVAVNSDTATGFAFPASSSTVTLGVPPGQLIQTLPSSSIAPGVSVDRSASAMVRQTLDFSEPDSSASKDESAAINSMAAEKSGHTKNSVPADKVRSSAKEVWPEHKAPGPQIQTLPQEKLFENIENASAISSSSLGKVFAGAEISQEETVLRAVWAVVTGDLIPDEGSLDVSAEGTALFVSQPAQAMVEPLKSVQRDLDSTQFVHSELQTDQFGSGFTPEQVASVSERSADIRLTTVEKSDFDRAAVDQSYPSRSATSPPEQAPVGLVGVDGQFARAIRSEVMSPAGAAPPSPVTQIVQAVTTGGEPVTEIRLAPEELGNVRIDMRNEGDHLILTVSAERQDTLDLLRRHADQLAAELRAAGQSAVSLSFGRWTGSGDGSASGGHPHAPPTQQSELGSEMGPEMHPPEIASYQRVGSETGLYLRV